MTPRLTVSEEPLSECSAYAPAFMEAAHGTAFHDPRWLSVVAEFVRGGIHVLTVREGEETLAVFPHAHGRKGPIRMTLSPPPRMGLQYLGPLLPGWEDLKQDKREQRLKSLADAIAAHLDDRKDRFCLIRSAPGLEDVRPFQWLGFTTMPRYTYLLDLTTEEDAWEGLKKNVRSDLRRHGDAFLVEEGGGADWERFDDELRRRFAEQGLPAPLPAEYLERLRTALPDAFTLLAVRIAGTWQGAALLVHGRGQSALWQGTLKTDTKLPVNDALIWAGIRHSCARRDRVFELMGANTRRLAQFKAKFNPRLVAYFEISRGSIIAKLLRDLQDRTNRPGASG